MDAETKILLRDLVHQTARLAYAQEVIAHHTEAHATRIANIKYKDCPCCRCTIVPDADEKCSACGRDFPPGTQET